MCWSQRLGSLRVTPSPICPSLRSPIYRFRELHFKTFRCAIFELIFAVAAAAAARPRPFGFESLRFTLGRRATVSSALYLEVAGRPRCLKAACTGVSSTSIDVGGARAARRERLHPTETCRRYYADA